MNTSMPNNVWTQHVAFCIGRKRTGQNYGIFFIYTPLIYYTKFWEKNVFLITHPFKTEINHKTQYASHISLGNQMTKNCLDPLASDILTPSMCQASQFIPANIGMGMFTSKPGVWGFDHITNKLQSFMNTNANTELWNKANIWNDSTKNSSTKILNKFLDLCHSYIANSQLF